jgi:hypothetical protein
MIKHTTTLTAAIVAAGAIAAAGSNASGHSSQKVIRLTEVPRQFQFVDVAPQGGPSKPPSQGDEFVIGARLEQSGKRVGTANLVCTVTRPGRTGLSQCVGTLTLPHGDITISGISRIATNSDVFAVTGGTGAYARARGTLSSRQTSGDNDALTVRLGP